MRLKLRLFYRIKVFNLMRSQQTSRTSQISHFRIRYEVGISFIRAIWEKLDKNTEAVAQICSVEKVFLEISQNSQKAPVPEFLIFLACNFIKREALTQLFSREFCKISKNNLSCEDVHVTIGNPVLCLALYLTGVHFRGELQHVGHGREQKIKCSPIVTRGIAGVRL